MFEGLAYDALGLKKINARVKIAMELPLNHIIQGAMYYKLLKYGIFEYLYHANKVLVDNK